jgi:hypothetical protein
MAVVTLPWTIPRIRACGYSGATVDSVFDEIGAKLSPGDDEERIHAVLSQAHVASSRDGFRGVVLGSKRWVPAPALLPGSVKAHLWVEVHVDDHDRYVSHEVTEVLDL